MQIDLHKKPAQFVGNDELPIRIVRGRLQWRRQWAQTLASMTPPYTACFFKMKSLNLPGGGVQLVTFIWGENGPRQLNFSPVVAVGGRWRAYIGSSLVLFVLSILEHESLGCHLFPTACVVWLSKETGSHTTAKICGMPLDTSWDFVWNIFIFPAMFAPQNSEKITKYTSTWDHEPLLEGKYPTKLLVDTHLLTSRWVQEERPKQHQNQRFLLTDIDTMWVLQETANFLPGLTLARH